MQKSLMDFTRFTIARSICATELPKIKVNHCHLFGLVSRRPLYCAIIPHLDYRQTGFARNVNGRERWRV